MLLALRLFGLVAGAIVGWQLGVALSAPQGSIDILLIVLLTTVGGALGAVLTPFLTYYPVLWVRHRIYATPASDLVAGGIGLIAGLIIAALLSLPLSMLPAPFGQFLPILAAAIFGYMGVAGMLARQPDFVHLFQQRQGAAPGQPEHGAPRSMLLDTSTIIDGRILAVSHTGFLDGELLVPRFVLEEVQHIADSSDVLRRNRGRRGLEVLKQLQKESPLPVQVIEAEVPEGYGVDTSLVRLARERHYAIVTNDYNLNRVAELQGVRVLNINELASAIRPSVLPGEELLVHVVQEGKEVGQGVAYLDDGTMVVVDQGRKAVGSERRVVVTRVLQTMAGRMIFAALRDNGAGGGADRAQPTDGGAGGAGARGG